jgi:hypothetical protein
MGIAISPNFFAEWLAPDTIPAGWVGLDYPTNEKLAPSSMMAT